jgi:aspartyl-tRNA(Asn)/glutamyl-tRNA(Gln) amidotransferase subunit B
MRSKEDAHDYRYFPEPDLQPLVVSSEFIAGAKEGMPELPTSMLARFESDYGLGFADSTQLVAEKDLADFFEEAADVSGNPKATANWILSELMRELNAAGKTASESPVSAVGLGQLVKVIDSGKISGKQGKEVLIEMFSTGKSAADVIQEQGLEQVSDKGEIEKIVDGIMESNPKQVAGYRGGNQKLLGFFVGQVMKASQGKANPQVVNEVLKEKL